MTWADCACCGAAGVIGDALAVPAGRMLPAYQFPGLGDPPVITQAAGIPAQRSQSAADDLTGALPRARRVITPCIKRGRTQPPYGPQPDLSCWLPDVTL